MQGPSSHTEKELLARVAAGDEKAFTQLFYAYHTKLGAYILRLTESFILAEEIVQDIFLKIWLQRENLVSIENFNTYLFVISRNHTFNCLKQVARDEMRKKEWGKDATAQLTIEEGEEVDYRSQLEKAIAQLPPQQKKIFLLHRQEGLPHLEIANRLGLSLETIKKHMSLALRGIRSFLK